MFVKGTICDLKNGKNSFYTHLRQKFVVLFEEEETMRYLETKGNRPRQRYILVCRLGDYEDFKKYMHVEQVADRHKSGVYLIDLSEVIAVSNSHVSNALERLD